MHDETLRCPNQDDKVGGRLKWITAVHAELAKTY